MSITVAEEDEVENFYASIQEEINHTLKQDVMINIGVGDIKIGNKAESGIEKFGLGIRN